MPSRRASVAVAACSAENGSASKFPLDGSRLWPYDGHVAFGIEFTSDAHQDFRQLDAHIRSAIREALETYLRHEPTKVSKSRIKRLRKLHRPQYRLRIVDHRVYYDVDLDGERVTVLGVVSKAASYDWLADNSIEEDDQSTHK